MKEQLIPRPKSDAEFRNESNRNNSAASAHAAPGIPIEWTNEKQRSYINSLETSFVNKLYQSRRLRDCHPQMCVQGAHPVQQLPFRTYNSSDQVGEPNMFMVARNRCSQKIVSPRNETPLESTADSDITVERTRVDNIKRTKTSEHLGLTARTTEKNPAFCEDSFGSTAEVSGQNFVEPNHRGKQSCEFIPKRFKRALANPSSKDQVVPLRNDTKRWQWAHNAPSKGEERGHHHLQLEYLESSICPKSIFTVS